MLRFVPTATIAIALASMSGRAVASERETATIAVLRTAAGGGERQRESRFIEELRIELEGFEVVVVDTESPEFTALPLKEKLDAVRSRTESMHPTATIWLEGTSPRAVLLNVVALGTGRAFIRVVEVEGGPNAERELAVAANELLGQAYMLSAPPRPRAVQASVEEIISKSAALGPAATVPDRRAVPGFATFFEVEGAIYHPEKDFTRFGGGLSLELALGTGALLRAGFAASAGPFSDPDDGSLSGWQIRPDLGAGYLWKRGGFRVGPVAGAAATRSTVSLALGAGEVHTIGWWSFRGSLGLHARYLLKPGIALFAEPRIGVSSNTRRFERSSDGRTVLRTPIVDGGASVGVCYIF